MKYFFIFSVLYFSFSVVAAMEDNCATNCSLDCKDQAVMAERALYSHVSTCRGEGPLQAQPECAQSCSKGCKAFMRGQAALLIDHFEVCGGGKGNLGRLECQQNGRIFEIVNSHSHTKIGDSFANESHCIDSVDTLNYNILCAKYNSSYAVFNKMGKRLGVGSSFLDQCVETLMTAKNDQVCLRTGSSSYAIFDLRTFEKVSKSFSFLSTCEDNL